MKSDDVNGRTKGLREHRQASTRSRPACPESFNVLVKEIRSSGIDIELEAQPRAQEAANSMKGLVDLSTRHARTSTSTKPKIGMA